MLRLSRVSIATVFTIALTQIASAADLPRKASLYTPPAISWSGWYGGLNAGYNWGGGSVSSTAVPTGGQVPALATALSLFATYNLDPDQNGFIGGGQVGYNWQFNNWVTGIEADIQGLANNGKANQPSVVQWTGFPEQYSGVQSGQADVTWLRHSTRSSRSSDQPSSLIYVTGGVAYGGVKAGGAVNAQESATFGPTFNYSPSVASPSIRKRVGWTLGGGGSGCSRRAGASRLNICICTSAPSAPTTMSAQSVAQLGYAAGHLVPFGTASVQHTSTRLNGNIAVRA